MCTHARAHAHTHARARAHTHARLLTHITFFTTVTMTTLTGTELQRVGVPTKKSVVPMCVSTLGTRSRSELDDRSV